MLYRILKIYVRLAVRLFSHSVYVDKKALLNSKGPLLLASNHPNSFLDAILFDILFDIPITSLARGDAFKNKNIFRLLRNLKMLPVYRIREGTENLNTNYETFDACIGIFKQYEGVLIFSEGLCVNEWHLRSLKKGTARLAFKAWNNNIPLVVLPVGINYSSFRKYGKGIHVHFGDTIIANDFALTDSDGTNYTLFNTKLKSRLQDLVYEIQSGDIKILEQKFGKTSSLQKGMLIFPALVGAMLHAPIYWIVVLFFKTFFSDTDHHDSIIFSFLLLTYPLYILLITMLAYSFTGQVWLFSIVLILPFTAWAYVNYEIRKG